jgi:uncharacterized protein YkwD
MRRATLITLAAGALLAQAAPAAHARACADAHASVASAGTAGQARAIRCLINRARAARGLRRLRASRPLGRAARAHSHDMVRRRYFDHVSPGGSSPLRRARRAGWRGSTLGETIACGADGHATAAATVRRWLRSGMHRRILLLRRLRAIGIGVAAGMPEPRWGDGGITVTADIGAGG